MSTQIRFIGLPRHIAVSVKEVTDEDGQRVTLVVFGSEPDAASKQIREYVAPAERVVTAVAPITRPPEPGLNETQLRQVREEVRVWWSRQLRNLFRPPPMNDELREEIFRRWGSLRFSGEDLTPYADEIAAVEALRRLAILVREADSNLPPGFPRPSDRQGS